jgi:hypothetical protein
LKKKVERDEVVYHGRLCDRKMQTEPCPGFVLYDKLNVDKFKRFFFAVFYTYIMMNVVLAEGMPKSMKK